MFTDTFLNDFAESIPNRIDLQIEEAKAQAAELSKEEILTGDQVCLMLNITKPTLTDYVKRGLIPAYRIGSRVRYKESEILEALKRIDYIKYKRA